MCFCINLDISLSESKTNFYNTFKRLTHILINIFLTYKCKIKLLIIYLRDKIIYQLSHIIFIIRNVFVHRTCTEQKEKMYTLISIYMPRKWELGVGERAGCTHIYTNYKLGVVAFVDKVRAPMGKVLQLSSSEILDLYKKYLGANM